MQLLIITSIVLNAFLAMTMAFFYFAHKTFPGFGHWTAGVLSIAASYLMIALRGVIPIGVSVLMVNVLVTMSGALYLDGMRRFLGLSRISPIIYSIPLILGIHAFLSVHYFDSSAWRAFWVSAVFACFHFPTAWIVFREYPKTGSTFYLVIGIEMALATLIIVARAIWNLSVPNFLFMMETPVETGFFISVMILQVIISVSFIMLNAERFNMELLQTQASLQSNVEALEKALAEVKTLKGILPICSSCKKIRDDSNNWVQMEVYVRDRTSAEFSHGICPDCLRALYPEFAENVLNSLEETNK